jgi:NADH:ubiquinone oxidoreductase subunit F (NADH-binding)/NADH:ubiquinone oxidoreductase subunit E
MTTRPVDELLTPFPPERTWLLPALQAVQADRGWLSAEDLRAVSGHLHVPRSEVYGVATHYPEFRLAAPGRHLVRVCMGVSCRVNGGLGLLADLGRRLGVAAGQTTADGEVTLEEADCCFVCSAAPVVEVDHAYLGAPTADVVLAACRDWHGAHSALAAGMAVTGPLADPHATAAPTSMAEPSGATARARLDALVTRAREHATSTTRLLVATGSCGLARGAAATRDALRFAVRQAGLAVSVEDGACNGLCHAQPVVAVRTPGLPPIVVEHLTPDRVTALLRLLRGADDHGLATTAWPHAAHPTLGGQDRCLAERWGAIRPGSLDDALSAGSYAALAGALDAGDPSAVTAAVKAAGLLGRGGAYFPAAVKWEGCRAARGAAKYLVANGEEGEPGIFKDRHLMEADPHRLLEGMLLAAYAAGASHGILYIHGEAGLSAERCAEAVREAHAAGLLGPRVLGTSFAFEIEIRRGAGGFVLGEETALLESIEGKRAMPRPKPPFPVEVGVHGCPTVINNVETLSAVPLIVGGRPEAARTKLFGLSGHVARPGVVEVAPPLTLRRLIDGLGGGLATGRPLGAVVIGGPSGIVVPPAFLDRPLERPTLSPGTGGIVALDAQADVRDVLRTLLSFNARESCGKCTPCREGTVRLLELLDDVARAGVAESLSALRELADVVQLASLCGLGQAAPLSLRAGLEHFPGSLAARPRV